MFRMVPFASSVEKVPQLEKSTPAVLVALVTNYSYAREMKHMMTFLKVVI